jgi:aminoglycoside phosphotransferase (APT) family kinase protein
MTADRETALTGGRQSGDVVRVGSTVRRQPGPRAEFVRELLRHLEAVGFDGAPRWLGVDDEGREILSYIEGLIDLSERPDGEQIVSAARLIRRFHDATAGSTLADGFDVVCHTDLGPHNTVFSGSTAVGLIDWDDAMPGSRLSDLGHAVWCFAAVDSGGPPAGEQARRVQLFCDAYRWEDPFAVVDEIERYHRSALALHQRAGRDKAAAIFQEMVDWHVANAPEIKAFLRRIGPRA